MKNKTITRSMIAAIIAAIVLALVLCSTMTQGQTWTPSTKVHVTDTSAHYQCWGTTKKGERCKRMVKCNHCYCYQHEYQK